MHQSYQISIKKNIDQRTCCQSRFFVPENLTKSSVWFIGLLSDRFGVTHLDDSFTQRFISTRIEMIHVYADIYIHIYIYGCINAKHDDIRW